MVSRDTRADGLGAHLFRGAVLALLLAFLRVALVVGLELAHHGQLELARLRVEHALRAQTLVALGLGAAAAAGLHLCGRLERTAGLVLRAFLALALALGAWLFLCGRLDEDLSRRVGVHTARGALLYFALALFSSALALALVFAARERPLGSWRGALAALALLGASALYFGVAPFAVGDSLVVRTVEEDLLGAPWEVVRARADAPPAARVFAPSARTGEEGASRPALTLAPPACVRVRVPGTETRYLAAGVGIDHGVGEDVGERYPGHRVRFIVRREGEEVFRTELPLAGEERWRAVGEGDGLRLPGGARLELETALIGPDGAEVDPLDPLLCGFSGLELEQRRRIPRAASSPQEPNLVLVLLDTLRADRTTPYGYARDTTPELDALARRGVVFEEACSTASWTWPATASILTGLQPIEHGVQDAQSSFLSGRVDTLAEALQRAGFTTAAWSGSPLIVPEKNFDQGFESFDASREGVMRRSDLWMPAALEWLGAVRGRRFFLYLHLMEPHAPLVPLADGRARFAPEVPSSFDPRKAVDYSWDLRRAGFRPDGTPATESVVTAEEQRWISDLYDACVWSGDYWLGRVLARLESLGLDDETIVLVTSDHGEELFDHALLGHAHALHRELVRVPLVAAGPGLPRGERRAGLCSNAAIGPTLARLGGTALVARAPLADLLAEPASEVLFSTRQGWWNGVEGQPLFGLRAGGDVLHYAPAGRPWGASAPPEGGELRLYDAAADPGEQRDRSASEPERAEALREELLRRLAELEERRVESGGFADEATLAMLRQLGYVR